MVLWCHGTLAPCHHGAMVAGYDGTMVPGTHGTMEPWDHGNVGQWDHGTRDQGPWARVQGPGTCEQGLGTKDQRARSTLREVGGFFISHWINRPCGLKGWCFSYVALKTAMKEYDAVTTYRLG